MCWIIRRSVNTGLVEVQLIPLAGFVAAGLWDLSLLRKVYWVDYNWQRLAPSHQTSQGVVLKPRLEQEAACVELPEWRQSPRKSQPGATVPPADQLETNVPRVRCIRPRRIPDTSTCRAMPEVPGFSCTRTYVEWNPKSLGCIQKFTMTLEVCDLHHGLSGLWYLLLLDS